MTIPEIERSINGLIVQVDTREQDTPKLRQRLDALGCEWSREKLDSGDYSAKLPLPDGGFFQLPVCIERKMSLDELEQCYTKGRDRFEREFERARIAGTKIYLLVENGSWSDLYRGRYRSHMSPKSFTASLLAWLARYNCQIIFCDDKISGQLIKDILRREAVEVMGRLFDL